MNFTQILKSFFPKKKRDVINGKDRLMLVDENSASKSVLPVSYNTVDDITTYTNQQLTASNGIYNDNGDVKLGTKPLTENTEIDTDGNAFSILSGDFAFSNLLFAFGPFSIPQLGVSADGVFHNSIIDREPFSPGLGKQVMNGYFNFATGEFAGLETSLDLVSGAYLTNLSARKVTQSGLQAGFSAKGVSSTEASADHYLYDQDINSDIAGNFVSHIGVYSWWAFNIVDADNWDEHRVDLNDNGWEFKVNRTKTAGSYGTDENIITFKGKTIGISNLVNQDFADDAAAALGGIEVGDQYHTAGVVKIRLV